MVSFELGKEREKDVFFLSGHGTNKRFWVPMRNSTSDLWIPCSDALPLSYRHSEVSAWGPLQSSYTTHILHTATCRISNVNSLMIAHRIGDISLRLSGRALEHKIRRSVVWFLMGTQNFFFVPCLWQDKNIFLSNTWPFGMLAFGSILLTTATESQPFLVSRYRTALCSSSFNFISAFVIPWRKKHLIKLQCDQWLYGCQANFGSHRRKRNCYKYSPCVHVGPYWHVQCIMLSLPQTPKRHKPQDKCGRNITITSAKGLHLKSRVYLEAVFHFP